jgi:CRP-like cAMP-binding protein
MKILDRQQSDYRTQSVSASRLVSSIENSAHAVDRSHSIDRMMMNMRTFSKRSLLRSDPETVWKIEAGIVRTLSFDEDGTIVVLGLWGVGDIVGQPYSNINPFQIECLTQVRVTEICARTGPLNSQHLIDHLHQLEELTVIRSYRKIDRMLIKLLEWLYDRFGTMSAAGKSLNFRMTHQDIADIVGSTRVSISRALRELEQQNVISSTLIETGTKFNYEASKFSQKLTVRNIFSR